MAAVGPDEALRAVSRRTFIKSVIAAGAVSSAACFFRTGTGPPGGGRAAGAVERLLTLKVNGQLRRVDVLKHETLATTLREKLGLTGLKVGCNRAECGSCTVLLDGVPHYACSVLTHTVRGREITTIEGLASRDGQLHPVQRAFVEELGFQCGFCTPGMILATVALLKNTPNPSRAAAADALSGNLCRCGDYNKILNAVLRAAALTRST